MSFAIAVFAMIVSVNLPAAGGLRQDSRGLSNTSAAHIHSGSDRSDSGMCALASAKADYYFDLAGGGDDKGGDHVALHLHRNRGKPSLTIFKHQVWNIKFTTAPKGKSHGELVFKPISFPQSPPKKKSKYFLLDEVEYIRQYYAANDKGEKVSCVEINFNSTNKLEFAGGTYYPEEKVMHAMQQLRKSKADDGPGKAKDEDSITPALLFQHTSIKSAAGYAVANSLVYFPASVFFVEWATPLFVFAGGPIGLAGLVASPLVWAYAKLKRRSAEAKFSAAEQLFEQLWCLSSKNRCHVTGGSDCFYTCPEDKKGQRMIVPWKKAKQHKFKCKELIQE